MWVFAYGSLIWQPDFPVAQTRLARLNGWRRAFCLSSIHHRGTAERPGLVLALDRDEGSHCDGVAFKVASGAEEQALHDLRARELVSNAYLETRLDVQTDDGTLNCLTYVINRANPQYCTGLSLEEQAGIIAEAGGGRGPNADYLFNTTQHLNQLGIVDDDLNWLVKAVSVLKNHA